MGHLGYNPPASDRPDPWTLNQRPRASMKPFRGAPWEPPEKARPPARANPAAWFGEYKRNNERYGVRPVSAAATTQIKDALSRYQRSNRNPGVGYDGKRNKFTLMVLENGVNKPFGSFLTEEEGVEGYAGMVDKKDRGPHGIEGLPRTNQTHIMKRDGVSEKSSRRVLMELNGPPGVQIQPAGYWQQNVGPKESTNVNNFVTPQNLPATPHSQPFVSRPTSASLLAGRPAAARRQRPSTALLRDKGQWSVQRQDHLHEGKRDDLCGAEKERVEYNPETMRKLWSGLWMEQRPPVGIPFDD